jgi:hypothetical protein
MLCLKRMSLLGARPVSPRTPNPRTPRLPLIPTRLKPPSGLAHETFLACDRVPVTSTGAASNPKWHTSKRRRHLCYCGNE